MTRRISMFQTGNFNLAIAFAAIFLFFVVQSIAQERRPDRGLQAGNSYAISDIETVNLQNGNMVLNIPLASLPAGKGSSPGYTVSLKYNSKLWDSRQERREDGIPDETGNTKYMRELLQASSVGGWHLDTGQYTLEVVSRLNLEEQVLCVPGNDYEIAKNGHIFKLEMRLPDGSVKEFRPLGSGIEFSDIFGDGYFSIDPNGVRHVHGLSVPPGSSTAGCNYTLQSIVTTGMHYYTNDGSGLRLFIPPGQSIGAGITTGKKWTLYYPDGRIIENAPADDPTTSHRITDRNGNRIYVRGSTIENDAGHKIEVNGDANGNIHIDQKGVAGALVRTTIQWRSNYVYRNYKASSDLNANPAYRYEDLFEGMTVVEKVILPTQAGSREFNFDYNGSPTQPTSGNYTQGWGELKSIELPSGAEALYDFHLDINPAVLGAFDVLNNTIAKRTLSYAEEIDGNAPLVTEETDYSIVSFAGVGSVSLPDGSGTVEYSDFSGSFKGYAYRVMSSNGTISEKIWAENAAPLLGASGGQAINAYVKAEIATIPDASGNPAFSAIKEFDYDKNGNVLEVREYDWVPYSSITRTGTGNALKVTALPSERTLLRKTVNSYYYPTPIATDTTTDSPNHYSNPSSPALLNLIKSTEVRDASDAVVSRSEFLYDGVTNAPVNGNLTSTRVWDNTKGALASPDADGFRLNGSNSVSTTAVYDQYGNVEQTTDANGTVTQITYGNVAGPNGNVTGLYPTQTVAAHGTPLARTSTAVYDFYTGLPTSSTDVDNGVTNATEYDALGRPTIAKTAVGTALESWTQTTYNDVDRYIVIRSDLETKEDGRKVAAQFFDQLGRVRLSKTLEDAATQSATNETDGIKVQTRYKTVAGYTYQLSSNPYRANFPANETDPTMGWTLSTAWSTGRRSEVQTFSGAGLPVAFGGSNQNSTGIVRTDIDANMTLVTDQAGKQRRSVTNALGQLIRVDEPDASGDLGTVSSPKLPTYYYYNTLGKMVRVNQGVQNRYFMHDSLGRLLRVRQPEQTVNTALNTSGNPDNNSWTIGFTYDNNGNVLTSRDANDVVITSTYDALNRVTQRSYNDNPQTPTVTYTYDDQTVPFSKGRLTKVYSTISEMRYTEYDEMGRLEKSEQRTDGEVYPSEYKYNLAGALIEQKYPSGRVAKNVLDASGDISNISSRVHNGPFKNYASNFEYTAGGVIKHLQIGNGLWESAVMNSRNQVLELKMGNSPTNGNLMHLTYEYGEFDTGGNVDVTKNAGNIAKQTITFNGLANPFVQSYKYDSLDRITEAKEMVNGGQTWIQQFGYDRYGNRTSHSEMVGSQAKAINEVTLPAVDVNTNKFSNTTDYEFDAVGNLVRDIHGRQFTFNGDNKQVEVRNSANQVVGEYKYDGLGKRIKKETATEYVVFVYDGLGKLIGEYSADGPPAAPTVNYTATDPLGSPRVLTNKQGDVVSRRDFMPFGEEIAAMAETHRTPGDKYGVGDNVRQKFTGYERDTETGLDFAEARYYYNNHGRFTAVDPLLASGKSADPQTFNRYAYTMNRPLVLTDSTGLQAGQGNLRARAKRVGVPRSVTTVTPSAAGVYIPPGGTNGVSAEFKLTSAMTRDLGKMKAIAYQLQFVITKDNLNEAVNGRIVPSTGSTRENVTQNRSRSDERSAGLTVDSEGKGEVNLGVKQGQVLGVERSDESTEQGPINSGDQAKADAYDILTDEVNNFAAKYEGTVLTGYTITGDPNVDSETVRAKMEYDFFVEVAQREIALAREEAIRNAIKSVPEK